MSINSGYKILVVGNIYDNHLVRFVSNLKIENPKVEIDVLPIFRSGEVPERAKNAITNVFWIDEVESTNKIVRAYKKIKGLRNLVMQLSANRHYDIINIQYPSSESYFMIDHFRKMGKVILVTPWGSDVYRSGRITRRLLKRIFDGADYVCGTGNRFSKDVQQIFNIPNKKMVSLDIGSESIDYFVENKDVLSKQEAKEKIGIKSDYVITCGYNAHTEQNHLEIIDAINEIRKELPKDLLLIFPMTYPRNPEYINEVKQKAKQYNLNTRFFENFLNLEELFLMRQATDMFIHVQTTDANAASVQEYILLNKNVVNGSWLRYSELEQYGLPYYIAESLPNLSQTILDAYRKGNKQVSEKTLQYIASYGWKPWIKKWNEFFVGTL